MNLKKINYGINIIIKSCDNKKISTIIEVLNSRFIEYTINKKNSEYVDMVINYEQDKFKFTISNNIYDTIDEVIRANNIVPKLFEKNLIMNKYENRLSMIEHRKDIEKSKIINKYNRLINHRFDVLDGINSIYEWYTGAVYFKDYEWNEIDNNNELKKFFLKKKNGSYIYSLPLDSGVILRGYRIYYYFSTDISRFEKPSILQVKKWFGNISEFLKDLKKIMINFKIRDKYDRRLILGVVDNLRNIILLLTNTELMFLSHNGNDFIYHDSYSKKILHEYFELIYSYQSIIENICFKNLDDEECMQSIITIIDKISRLKNKTLNCLSSVTNSFILSKCFNPLREIDNYIENYIVCKYIVKQKHLKNKQLNILAILYGGLELPFIIKRLCNNNINISFLFQNHGMYLERQQKEINIINQEMKEYGSINKDKSMYIVDDNIMSGVTMQFAYNKLFVNNYNSIKGIFIIRHPNINRIAQLENFDIALNLKLVDTFIYGMLTDTPYSKIKRKTNLNNMFVNELNIFSIMTEIFLKALYCNNSFIKDSQVDIFKGYSEGKHG